MDMSISIQEYHTALHPGDVHSGRDVLRVHAILRMSIRTGKELFLVIVISILIFIAFRYTPYFDVKRISRGHIRLVFKQRNGITTASVGAEAKVIFTQLHTIFKPQGLDYQ